MDDFRYGSHQQQVINQALMSHIRDTRQPALDVLYTWNALRIMRMVHRTNAP